MATRPAKKKPAKKSTKKVLAARRPSGAARNGKAKRPVVKRAAGATARSADPGMSDDAVRRATGKAWDEWFAILDEAGARGMKHADIAVLLHEQHGVGEWWCQMVTVGYERARGLREKHQRPDGYSVSASRTIAAPVARVFEAWSDARARSAWLPEAITIRRATADKSLRITWGDGATSVEVNLYAKGPGKSQVAVQHSKIADRAAAEGLKAFWGERLDALKERLGG